MNSENTYPLVEVVFLIDLIQDTTSEKNMKSANNFSFFELFLGTIYLRFSSTSQFWYYQIGVWK